MASQETAEPIQSGRKPRRLRILIGLALAAAGFAGWWHFPSATRFHVEGEAAGILAAADSWELLSLTRDHPPEMREKLAALKRDDPLPAGLFHGFSVLGRVAVGDQSTRRTLTRNFNRARSGWSNWTWLCWNPRHAIRASLPTGESVDFLICFECLRYRIVSADGTPIDDGTVFDSHTSVFNDIYRSLGLEIASRRN